MRIRRTALAFLCLGPIAATAVAPVRTTVAALVRETAVTNRTAWHLQGRIVARGPTLLSIDDGTGLAVCDWHSKDLEAGDTIDFLFADCRPIPNAETAILSGKLFNPRKTGHAAPPEPVRTTIPKLLSGALSERAVTVEGVVTDVAPDEVDPDWFRLTLESEGARLAVTFRPRPGDGQPVPADWLDAAIRVTGFFHDRSGAQDPLRGAGARRNIGGLLFINGPEDVSRLASPQADRFRFPHRERIAGTVLATWGGASLFLRAADDLRVRVNLQPDAAVPAVGSAVTLAGFRRSNDFFDWFANATVLSADAPEAAPEPPEDLPAFIRKRGSRAINPNVHGRIIRIEGRAKDILRTEGGTTRLALETDGADVAVELGRLPAPPLGSRISVTGAGQIAFEPNQNDNIHVRLSGVTVIPRRADDIVLLVRPPWWTSGRLLAVICALAAGLIGISIWNRALRRLAERRGRQLLRAQIEGERSSLRIGERTRLAVELHDALSQNLTGVGLQLDAYRCARADDAAAAEHHLETAERILSSCRVELRRCLCDLRSDALEETDFAAAIRKVLQPFAGKATIVLRFHVPRARLGDSAAHAILRIVRELTANAVAHGHAKRIHIAGSYENGAVLFSVADDGCGFDPVACPGPADGHFGLTGIRERIRERRGSFDLKTTPGGGTKIRITLPV